MRFVTSCLFVLSLGMSSVAQQATDVSLDTQVKRIAEEHHGSVALLATDLKTGQTVALHPDEVVATASTIKLAILYEALEQLRAGKNHWDDKITIEKNDLVSGAGILLMFDTPHTVTFKDVLTMMIVMSDNSAANLAMDHVGIANVDNRMAALGLKNTYLYKKVMKPVAAGVTMPADQPKFGLGKTTPREMAALMAKIATCQLGNDAMAAQESDLGYCKVAWQMLHWQFYRSAVPRYLTSVPGYSDDAIANKTGSLNASRSDIAAISTKSGMVVIAAFTYDNKDQSWGYDQEGETTIAKLARAIVSTWSPAGLAPWPSNPQPAAR